MDRPEPRPDATDDHDLIDAVPPLGRASEQLERSLGPSCLVSLAIVFVVALVLKRFLRLSWIGLTVVAIAVWLGVVVLLARWRARSTAVEDGPGEG